MDEKKEKHDQKYGITTVDFIMDIVNDEINKNMKRATIAVHAYIISGNESKLLNIELYDIFLF